MSGDEHDEVLEGQVTALVFTNPDNGFAVVELDVADGERDRPRAAGPLAELVTGQPVRLRGRWTTHPRHGETFDAVSYEPAAPTSPEALVSFLASDRFAGIGPTLAQRLVDAFGLELPAVIEADPLRLAAVKGVSAEKARKVAAAWLEAGALARLVRDLVPLGVPPRVAAAAHRRYGEDAAETLAADPYRLLEVAGGRWEHADALARAQGIDRDDDRRLAAGAAVAQREACARDGHTVLDDAALVAAAGRLLGGHDVGRRAARAAEDAERLVREGDGWYQPADLAAEQGLAESLRRLLDARSRVAPLTRDVELADDLTDEQRAAVTAAAACQVSVLTGGPGTGKTRTLREVVRVCHAAELRVALCAPTGRAAKRLSEVTGVEAATVHRLLEARPRGEVPGGGEGFVFGIDEGRRLPHDVVIADEWSMADTRLAWALARAVDDGAHLILVGDADQLPSVGTGAVLRDLLAAAEVAGVAATRLTMVHRQAAASRIVTLAHEVNAGSVEVPQGRDGDVFAVPQPPDALAQRIAVIVADRAPGYFGCTPGDVQVLAPMYRSGGGVDAINAACKERLNPTAGRSTVAGLCEGDRVVQTRNDPELDVANGDVGDVAAVTVEPADDGAPRRHLEVAFPHGLVIYDAEAARNLAPAWCLTVHKAQGGEWPVVVLALDPAHRQMLRRELVYTALTRAARALLLVGDPRLVAAAAAKPGAGAAGRRTGLAARLAFTSH